VAGQAGPDLALEPRVLRHDDAGAHRGRAGLRDFSEAQHHLRRGFGGAVQRLLKGQRTKSRLAVGRGRQRRRQEHGKQGSEGERVQSSTSKPATLVWQSHTPPGDVPGDCDRVDELSGAREHPCSRAYGHFDVHVKTALTKLTWTSKWPGALPPAPGREGPRP